MLEGQSTHRPPLFIAMSTLYCALDPIEYNRVSGCDSAKEIWDKLEVTYEGTNQVKESKMNMLVHEYELFVMKKDENISEMSTRSLPKRWEAKMTAISEARDLKVLTLEELFGSLMTYELEMNSKVEEEEVKPKKNFALKSSHHDHDNSEEERDEEEEIALMTRNFKKFLKKKKGFGRRFPKKGENKGESSKTETPTCYKCKKQGHYKNECPQVNKEKMKYKKKALKVTWDDSDESDSDNNSSDNEVANLCLLGYINESNISEDEHTSFCPLAFNDDESATEDLCLMAHGDEDKWFLDSGCSRHMTGDKNKFTSLTLKDGGNVKFGDNSKGKIIGIDNLGKFDAKSDEGIFLGYSLNSKAYRVFNKRTMVVDESMHVVFDETNPFHIKNNYDDEPISLDNKASSSNQVDSSENIKDQVDEPQDEEKALPPTKNEELPKSWNVVHSHPKELIIGEVERGVSTRSKLKNICNNMAFLSQIEPKNINEAIEDESWILAMQEELNQFERNKVWTLAPRPKDHSVIGTKWVFRNKKDEEGIIVRNKARLVAQGYNQEEAYGTPMSPSTKLDKDEKGKPVDVKLYRVKRIFRYLLGTIDLGLWYPKSNSFDLISYTDADFAGCKIDRKSTSGTCHFLGHSLVSWFSKKQNSVALSTAEAEYVAAGSCCAQSLYIKQQLEDFKILFDHIPIRCDNTSAISLSKNPIQHSRTKHIEIRYHFIRDHVQKGDIELEFVSTDSQWADILTKPLIEERFCTIRREIGMARYVDIK
uniref:CCHC-type domain-containing protein n=1 Tax=Fagus sylvatica TaxID=28930 RepID=A0A2N9HLR4_FAGSY